MKSTCIEENKIFILSEIKRIKNYQMKKAVLTLVVWIFRSKLNSQSGETEQVIPEQSEHLFRTKLNR